MEANKLDDENELRPDLFSVAASGGGSSPEETSEDLPPSSGGTATTTQQPASDATTQIFAQPAGQQSGGPSSNLGAFMPTKYDEKLKNVGNAAERVKNGIGKLVSDGAEAVGGLQSRIVQEVEREKKAPSQKLWKFYVPIGVSFVVSVIVCIICCVCKKRSA